jgi:transposase-like protein
MVQIENKNIFIYAKGMTTRDIQTHITELYDIDISPTLVSNNTDKIVHLAEAWKSRVLYKIYEIVFFDAIHYKIRDESGKTTSKAAYTAIGVDIEGHKDLLGLWVDQAEGANFWLNVLNKLKNRGVEDIFIAVLMA